MKRLFVVAAVFAATAVALFNLPSGHYLFVPHPAQPVDPLVSVPGEDDPEEDEDEDDDEIDPDDVEAGLDVILKDRLVVVDEEEDEEDEVPDPEDRTEGPTKVLPKRPGEFVCQSCFLVKHPSQLADADRMYCRDCV